MEGWVERSRIDLQRLIRVGADHLRNPISVARTPAQRLQNDEVERALEQFDPRQRLFRHGDAPGKGVERLRPWM